MDADFPRDEAVGVLGAGELAEDQQGAGEVGQGGGDGRPGHPHVEPGHKEQVQHHVHQAAHHQVVQGPLGIPHRPEDARPHVEQEGGDGAQEVQPEVEGGVPHDLLGILGPAQGVGGQEDPHHRDDGPCQQAEGHGGVDGVVELLLVPCAVAVGDHHRGPGGEAGEDPHHQLHDHRGGAPHRSQGVRPHKLAHDDGVHGAVKLLEQGPNGDGEEKEQELFPDNPFGQVQVVLGRFHGDPS